MKKLWKIGAAIAVLALLFIGCPEDDPPPKKKPADTPAYVTGITLSYASGTATGSTMPVGLNAGDVITFSAAVTGTPGTGSAAALDTTYSIAVTCDVANAITQVTNPNGSVTVTVANPVPGKGAINVTATSNGKKQDKTSATASWSGIKLDPDEVFELPNWVNSIKLYYEDGENKVETAPATVNQGTTWKFGATVAGEGDFNDTYTLTVAFNPEDVKNTVTGDAVKTVVIDPDYVGAMTVTATANGEDESGTALAPVTWNINVVLADMFGNPVWKFINTTTLRTGASLNPSTTTALPTPTDGAGVTDKRYIIFNNEPLATIDQNANIGVVGDGNTHPNCFRDVSVMYLDIPFSADLDNFKSYGIEARIRISKWRDSAPINGSEVGGDWGGVRQGVIMGMIQNPANFDFAFDGDNKMTRGAPHFVGWRTAASGQKRVYNRRTAGEYGSGAVNSNVAINIDIPNSNPTLQYMAQLDMAQYNSTEVEGQLKRNPGKKEGFYDQEYIYRITRFAAAQYLYQVISPQGTVLVSGNSTQSPSAILTGDSESLYLAFMVYGVEAEISDIKVYYDLEAGAPKLAWADPKVAGATTRPIVAQVVNITANPQEKFHGDEENDWSAPANEFPVGGVALTAEVLPLLALPRGVDWSVDTLDNGPVYFDEDAAWRKDAMSGKSVFTATPKAGGVNGTFKFYLQDPSEIVTPTGVEITTQGGNLRFGHTLTLEAEVKGATGVTQAVEWSVFAADGTSTTTDAWLIKPDVLTGAFLTTDATVKVVATVVGFPAVKSDPLEVTIKAFDKDALPLVWTFGADAVINGWVKEGEQGSPNTGVGKYPGGLTMTPPSGNVNWRPGQSTAIGFSGCLQPSTTEAFVAEIINLGIPVRVSMVRANTGDNWSALNRNSKITIGTTVDESAFGLGPNAGYSALEVPSDAPQNVKDFKGTNVEFATHSAIGTGAIKLELTGGSARIWEIVISDPDAEPFETTIWEWKAGDAGDWPVGATAANASVEKVNDMPIVKGSGNNSLSIEDGTGYLVLTAGRFTVGLNNTATNNASANVPHLTGGQINLTTGHKVKITVKYESFTFTGNGGFFIYLNNTNASGNNGSPVYHPAASAVFSGVGTNAGGSGDCILVRAQTPKADTVEGPNGDTITVTFDPKNVALWANADSSLVLQDVLRTSYFQFRQESSGVIKISQIKIEYLVE